MQAVRIPQVELIWHKGRVFISREWILRKASRMQKPETPAITETPKPEAHPADALEVVDPDRVFYHDGEVRRQVVLSELMFKMLKFIMGQEGYSEHMETIAATVWGYVDDYHDAVHGVQTRINRVFRFERIPLRLAQRNNCLMIISASDYERRKP